MKKRHLTLRLSWRLYAALKQMSEDTGSSIADIIRTAATEYLIKLNRLQEK